jgi:hypothetical protein
MRGLNGSLAATLPNFGACGLQNLLGSNEGIRWYGYNLDKYHRPSLKEARRFAETSLREATKIRIRQRQTLLTWAYE